MNIAEHITTSFVQYYGTDWAGMVLSGLQIYSLGNKKRSGFVFGIAANVCWFLFSFLAETPAGMLVNLFLFGMNIRGYCRWAHA